MTDKFTTALTHLSADASKELIDFLGTLSEIAPFHVAVPTSEDIARVTKESENDLSRVPLVAVYIHDGDVPIAMVTFHVCNGNCERLHPLGHILDDFEGSSMVTQCKILGFLTMNTILQDGDGDGDDDTVEADDDEPDVSDEEGWTSGEIPDRRKMH